jgi:hypothetical protein
MPQSDFEAWLSTLSIDEAMDQNLNRRAELIDIAREMDETTDPQVLKRLEDRREALGEEIHLLKLRYWELKNNKALSKNISARGPLGPHPRIVELLLSPISPPIVRSPSPQQTSVSGVTLGTDLQTHKDVVLTDEARSRGLYVLGITGSGKTTLLASLACQDMKAGYGLCFLDPHGDVVDQLLERVPRNRLNDLVLLDASNTSWPFGLNPYYCPDPQNTQLVTRLAQQATGIFEKLWGSDSDYQSWGPRVAQVMRNCAYLLLTQSGQNPCTMAEIPLLLLDDSFRSKLVQALPPQYSMVRLFWEKQFAIWARNERERQTHIESTINKLAEFLENPLLLNIVGHSQSTVNFRYYMDSSKIVLAKLPIGLIGDRAANLIGCLLVGEVLNAALARQDVPASYRRQFNLYADEYHRFSTPDFATLLAEARKFSVATTIAHQWRGQLDPQNRGAALGVANKVFFQVASQDREELAGEFDHTPPPVPATPLMVVPNPVDYLLRHPHPNSHVNRLVQMLLRPIVDAAAVASPTQPVERVAGYFASKSNLLEAISLLDSYFTDIMDPELKRKYAEQGRPHASPLSHAREISEVIWPLRGYLGIAEDWITTVRRTAFSSSIEYIPGKWSVLGSLRQTDNIINNRAANRLSIALSSHLRHVLYPNNPDVWEDWDKKLERSRIPATLEEPVDLDPGANLTLWMLPQELERLKDFGTDLLELGELLLKEPVLVNPDPLQFPRPHERTYADVHNEIASQLTNLPKWVARCKIMEEKGSAEYTIRTKKLEPPEAGVKVKGVVGPNAPYLRSRSEVESEIVERQQIKASPPTQPTARVVEPETPAPEIQPDPGVKPPGVSRSVKQGSSEDKPPSVPRSVQPEPPEDEPPPTSRSVQL